MNLFLSAQSLSLYDSLFFLFFSFIFAIFHDHLQYDARGVLGRPRRPLIFAPEDSQPKYDEDSDSSAFTGPVNRLLSVHDFAVKEPNVERGENWQKL